MLAEVKYNSNRIDEIKTKMDEDLKFTNLMQSKTNQQLQSNLES